jgi:hypothetical protein
LKIPPCSFDKDVCILGLLECRQRQKYHLCLCDLRLLVTGIPLPQTKLTLARDTNSFRMGRAGCSRLSMTRVRGLAPSRRLSSFCNSSKLCDRAWVFEVGAMLQVRRGAQGYRGGMDKQC